MASQAYIDARRCTALRLDGEPCQAWACWDDPEQRCVSHNGRHHVGPLPNLFERRWERHKGNVPPCWCPAYVQADGVTPYCHRPGGGRCPWPEVENPEAVLRATAAST